MDIVVPLFLVLLAVVLVLRFRFGSTTHLSPSEIIPAEPPTEADARRGRWRVRSR